MKRAKGIDTTYIKAGFESLNIMLQHEKIRDTDTMRFSNP